ncbi:MAG: hypothetical protein JST21_16060 [Bacteroidetes bacterium]|nr:hypothetical protein [Bacteroidota bacterium]
MKSNDQRGLQFKVQFEGTPTEAINYQVAVFDRDKNVTYQSLVNDNSFSLPFSSEDLKGKRIFLAPFSQDRKNELSLDNLDKGNGFEVNLPLKINPDEPVLISPIPEYIWCWWWYCLCQVRGRVFNWCGNEYLPVYKARVHICEVDPIIWYLQKLPDYEVYKLRDDILGKIKDWHLPDPPPEMTKTVNPNVVSKISTAQPMASINKGLQLDTVTQRTTAISVAPRLPEENLASFYSDSAYLIRNYLVNNYHILYPFWCWIYPWFLKSDEVAVVETDQNGWFNSYIWYPCCGDKPDLYFWVEYNINGVWTTVYNPGLRCGTHWDYPCNTEVDIYLNDQRIPCPIPQPNIGFKDVFVFSIGNDVSVTKVYQDGAMKGQTMPGTPYEEGSPFGGSVEPRVYFGSYLCDNIDGGNNYFYKWSYRKESDLLWKEITTDTFRHYLVETSDGPIFKPYNIGANADKLYQILRYHLPLSQGGNDLWVVDSRTDTASTKFITTDLDENGVSDDYSLTDGVYEIKMELYKYVAGVATRVNWTAEGINLFVPDHTLASPFGDVTINHETDNTIINQYKYIESGNLFGFTMKIFIDNLIPHLSLEDVTVTNADATTAVAGPCGFLAFKNRHTSTVNFKFNASQQNNFATFGFEIIKGNGTTDTFIAGNRVGVASTPLLHNSAISGANLNLVGGDYELHVTPDFILGSCNKAAFSQIASVHPLVQDGYSRLYNNWSLATAFALEHHVE